jgi:hypothetical protein
MASLARIQQSVASQGSAHKTAAHCSAGCALCAHWNIGSWGQVRLNDCWTIYFRWEGDKITSVYNLSLSYLFKTDSMVHIYSSSYSGGWGRRIAWAQEFDKTDSKRNCFPLLVNLLLGGEVCEHRRLVTYLFEYLLFICLVGLSTYKAGTLPLEPHLMSILLWLFWKWGSHELFVWAGLESQSSQSQLSK